MENLIKFEKRTVVERNVLGTVAEIAGPGAEINFIKDNLNDWNKRLQVILKRPDGTSSAILCSPTVSKGVRNKEIRVSQLAGFPIIEHVVGKDYKNAGLVMPIISMPEGQSLISGGEITQVVEYKPEVFDPADLIAF